ncbi:MAG TPA: hypothetical protein VGB26_10900 [Nitrospiria bacterium]
MKLFMKNFFAAIPLALGIVFTIFSVVNAMEAANHEDNAFAALFFGVIGVPLLFASIMSVSRDPNA